MKFRRSLRHLAILLPAVIFSFGYLVDGAPAPLNLETKLTDGELEITTDEKIFTTYRFSEKLKKPYFYPVMGPVSGRSVTVESVAGQYPHHNSIWLGCDRVNGQNFWQPHGKISNGQIRSEGCEVLVSDGPTVVFVDRCIWQMPGAKPVIRDTRAVAVRAPSRSIRIIDIDIVMTMLTEVTVQRTNHSLFSVRMVPELSVDGGGILANAQGDRQEKGTFAQASPWCMYYGTRDGDTEGLTLMQHPGNSWYPCKWFTRDYGFMSPTPMFWSDEGKKHSFSQGTSLLLRYRIVVFSGDPKKIDIPDLFEEYASGPVTPPFEYLRKTIAAKLDTKTEIAGLDQEKTFGIPSEMLFPEIIPQKQLETLQTYRFGNSREDLYEIEAIIRDTSPAFRPNQEAQLLSVLMDEKTTPDGKMFICEVLRRIGGDASVPVLSSLLTDQELALPALATLESIRTPAALKALRDAVPRASKKLKIAIISSLGACAENESLPLLRSLATDADPAIAAPAVEALARFHTPEALKVLRKISPGKELAPVHADALVRCAARAAETGHANVAKEIFEKLVADRYPPAVRAAACIGLTRCQGIPALPFVRSFLEHDRPLLSGAAAEAIRTLKDQPDTTEPLCALLPELPTHGKIILLSLIAERDDPAAVSTVRALLKADEREIRIAAYDALGRLGGADEVRALVTGLDNADDAEQEAAVDALIRLKGAGVTEKLVEGLNSIETAPGRAAWLTVIRSRGHAVNVNVLLALLRDENRTVKRKALQVLGELGSASEIPELIRVLDRTSLAEPDRQAVEQCLVAISRNRIENDNSVELYLDALEKISPEGKASLCNVLGVLAPKTALPAIEQLLENDPSAVRLAAVRALSEWPGPEPFEKLLDTARATDELKINVLALRGCRRFLDMMRAASTDVRLRGMFEACAGAARRKEERKLFVFRPSGILLSNLTVQSEGKYLQHRSGMKQGAKWATDRDYTFTDVPAEIVGATYIEVTMDDKNSPADTPFMRFSVDEPVAVFVAYDHRCTAPPKWLENWKKTTFRLDNTANNSQLFLYRKEFPPGEIVLGGNRAPGANAMYVPCVKPVP